MKTYHWTILLLLTIVLSCKTFDPINDDTDYQKKGSGKDYVSRDSAKAKEINQFISKLESESYSFESDFVLRLDNVGKSTEKFVADGKLQFSKETGLLKIQLMDSYFGVVISKIVSDEKKIRILSAGQSKVVELPFGDLPLTDPATKKVFSLPFPVIYHCIVQSFTKEFSNGKALVDPTQNQVLLKKTGEEYLYKFNEKGLERIDLVSPNRSLKSYTIVKEYFDGFVYPAKKYQTKVESLETGKEKILVLVTLKGVRKKTFSDSNFEL